MVIISRTKGIFLKRLFPTPLIFQMKKVSPEKLSNLAILNSRMMIEARLEAKFSIPDLAHFQLYNSTFRFREIYVTYPVYY